ncbi:LacI family DNA-binding transcriptional regulator [Nocardiopsis alba]|uniref:LacI family DNA-binding transcriptional regulator n=1 Tax=Nocardiopsis alba TaxID=53437 RepID=UPI003672C370
MSQRPPSMRDVARRTGVSLSTVSRVLRDAPGVAPHVRERVRAAADELSYVVSRNASGLVTGRTGRVAAVLPRLGPWYFGTVLSGLGDVLSEAGLDLLVYRLGSPEARDTWLRDLPPRRNADAVITLSMDLTEDEYRRMDRIGVPLVFTGQRVPGRSCVHVDNRAGTLGATRHLLNLGHSRIAYIGTHGEHGSKESVVERLSGYTEAMIESGHTPWHVAKSAGHRGGEHGMGELLSAADPPTAVLAETDEIALGALRSLRRAGVPVPEAISLVGFDNHEASAVLDLTTVDQEPRRIGAEAGRLALEALREPASTGTHVCTPTQLLLRRSTAAPRSTRGLS